ncbi:hypothetical protein CR513_13156, partial [Mucuna pruriens]
MRDHDLIRNSCIVTFTCDWHRPYNRLDLHARPKSAPDLRPFPLTCHCATKASCLQGEKLRCPCNKCKCLVSKFVDEVRYDLYEQGGQIMVSCCHNFLQCWLKVHTMQVVNKGKISILTNYAKPSIGEYIENMEENPITEAQIFFDMLAVAQVPLLEGCDNHSELSISLAALSLKSDYNMSEGCFNRMVQLMGGRCLKSVQNLGLGCLKIDCCPKGCMFVLFVTLIYTIQSLRGGSEEYFCEENVVLSTHSKTTKIVLFNSHYIAHEMA